MAAKVRTDGGSKGVGVMVSPLSYRLDLHENKEANTVSAVFELPGVKSEDVDIDVHQNRLTVSGEFKADIPPDDPGYVVRERPRDKFSRTINLPAGVKVSVAVLRVGSTRDMSYLSAGGRQGEVGERALDRQLPKGDSRAGAATRRHFVLNRGAEWLCYLFRGGPKRGCLGLYLVCWFRLSESDPPWSCDSDGGNVSLDIAPT